MMDAKKVVGTSILLLLLVGLVSLFFIYKDSILPKENLPAENVASIPIQIEDKKITETTKPFAIDITYPFVAGLDGFNSKVYDAIDNEIATFKKNSLDNDVAVKETDPESYAEYPRQYDLKISYIKGQVDENVVSVVLSIYNFSGGAHGNGYFISFNYDPKNNKEITLADVFMGQENYLQKVSDYASEDITKQITERAGNADGSWIKDGAGPKEENFSVFLLNKDTITFYFSPYQVAAYAMGDFQVTMVK